MSRRKKDTRIKSNETGNWRDRLHTVHFSITEEAEVRDWATVTKPSWSDMLEELVDDGWAVKVSPPGTGDDYWCSATCKSSSDTLGGHTFSVHYPSFEGSVLLAYWLVMVAIEDGRFLPDVITKPSRWLDNLD